MNKLQFLTGFELSFLQINKQYFFKYINIKKHYHKDSQSELHMVHVDQDVSRQDSSG